MPQPNYLSFSSPEQQAQAAELERRQKMADMLRQDSMTPLESQTVSNPNGGSITVKSNPWAGVAKLAQAYAATKTQENVDAKRLEMANALNATRNIENEKLASMVNGTPDQPMGPPTEQGEMGVQPGTPPASRKELALALMQSTDEGRRKVGD